ncbi:MAG: toxin, partial [bacterium]|nr:toxin [bacterium]
MFRRNNEEKDSIHQILPSSKSSNKDSSNARKESKESKTDSKSSSPVPSISLPKGGGAIRGIGEKFQMNPVTGTGALSVPIFTTPGRSDFYPKLSLNYDSGAGNGPFGLGWNLSIPSITRKTDKGLPKYQDYEESDTFILSGAEDLVPALVKDDTGKWIPDTPQNNNSDYDIHRYRPRIEGLFARIEKWQHKTTGEIHWKSISKDNVTSIYGKSKNSRISDPDDDSRIFQWLLEESYDDKGNIIVYEYKQENNENIDSGLPQEKNRLKNGYANLYVKRILYGNQTPFLKDDWHFELVFDYGEHDLDMPDINESHSWPFRSDAFSSYRTGFEIRTQRLCRRVLMFHHFPDELEIDPYLVRATKFEYQENLILTYLTSAKQIGYLWDSETNDYKTKELPPLEFGYSKVQIKDKIQSINAESLENLPIGLDDKLYQWVDLDGEGISGILTEQGGGWFYKRNLGNIPFDPEQLAPKNPPLPPTWQEPQTVRFAPTQLVTTKPSLANLRTGQTQIMNLAGDGQKDLVLLDDPVAGFFERTDNERWESFIPFSSLPKINWKDPNLKFIDLNGDGHADILITESDVFTWYPSKAEEGFASAEHVRKAFDEEQGPTLIFADATQSVYLADMSGDGLTDIVRIRNGEVCYWPNLGYGHFGAKVTMDNAPYFDYQDQFNQNRIRLADIDGSGTTDIIYLAGDSVRFWFNQSGNSWSETQYLNTLPQIDNLSSVMVIDLLGNGTACIVWSSPLSTSNGHPMYYIDLMGNQKPHLMLTVKNNMGAETILEYTSSTKFYLEDLAKGKPWITKLPFPVHVVERVETRELIT